MHMASKKVLGIYSTTCCEGCQVQLLNLGKDLLKLFDVYELGNFSWAEDLPDPDHFDICLVEGSPITDEDRELCVELRHKSDVIVAFGTCAHLGGVQEIRNYMENTKDQAKNYVYPMHNRVKVNAVLPVHKVIKVDYTIPTCPVVKEEVIKILAGIDIKYRLIYI